MHDGRISLLLAFNRCTGAPRDLSAGQGGSHSTTPRNVVGWASSRRISPGSSFLWRMLVFRLVILSTQRRVDKYKMSILVTPTWLVDVASSGIRSTTEATSPSCLLLPLRQETQSRFLNSSHFIPGTDALKEGTTSEAPSFVLCAVILQGKRAYTRKPRSSYFSPGGLRAKRLIKGPSPRQRHKRTSSLTLDTLQLPRREGRATIANKSTPCQPPHRSLLPALIPFVT